MKRLLIDLSSVVWSCLMAGKDQEFGKKCLSAAGKEVWVNSASWGYENAVSHLITVMDDLKAVPRQMIFVEEGPNAKLLRTGILPTYKEGRDKVPEQYVAFNEVKQKLLAAFLSVGAQSVTQEGVEADDVLGYLARQFEGERWIVSSDKDLAQCVDPVAGIHHYRMGVHDANPFGDFPHKFIPVYIALVGDSTDKIPGAYRFGEVAFAEMYATFGDGGLEAMERLIKTKTLEELVDDLHECKHLQKILDNRQNVYISYDCGRLRTDKVNSLRYPLRWTAGMCKPRAQIEDERLRKFGGVVTLISAENYKEALEHFTRQMPLTPEVALDIETSTPPQSDDWLEALGKSEERTPVDVFGSTLTGLGVTFGRNMEKSFYLTVDHVEEPGVTNLTVDMVREMLEKIPRQKHIVVHNAAFELPICFMSFGKHWEKDPDYHGFLPNVVDTRIMSSYVDENRSAGLKSLSKEVLGYEQETYQEVTTRECLLDEWDGVGKDIGRWHRPVPTGKFEKVKVGTGIFTPGKEKIDPETGEITREPDVEVMEEVDGPEIMDHESGPMMIRVQHKMNELTARHVLSYGADDTICTAALSNHFRTVMEIEKTWGVFMEVEQFPAYVTARAFIDGVNFSLESMRKMEDEDKVTHDEAWAKIRDYLIHIGFDGVAPPVFTELTMATANSVVKTAVSIVLGQKLETLVKTPSKLGKLIRQTWEDDPEIGNKAAILATFIEEGNVAMLNELVARHHRGEPKLDLASPKQMKALLYDHMKLPVHIINDCTTLEKLNKPDLADAVDQFKKIRAGHSGSLSQEQLDLVRLKAKADDTAIDFALAFDTDQISPIVRGVLEAIGSMKRVMTRTSLFYNTYSTVRHWKDNRIHAQLNQCAAVTRRYSSSNPNLQQLPKKGQGVKFRACFLPHRRDAVICSIDFVGQELRIAAERSQDRNMLACYVGDHLKDPHSITAAGAMKLKWGAEAVKQYMEEFGQGIEPGPDAMYELFIRLRKLGKSHPVGKKAEDLRKDSKNVNFAAQFGGQAAKLSETLIMPLEDAKLLLEARSAMFPGVDEAAERAEQACMKTGYATTMMGARRHLQKGIVSEDRMESSRAARQAWNMEIQGSAAEMTKLAMSRLWKSGALHKYDVQFIAPIHDELVTSVHRDHAVEFIKIKHACMTAPYANMGNPTDPKSVPILGSISIGPNFAEQHECGDWFIQENIEQALNDIFTKKVAA